MAIYNYNFDILEKESPEKYYFLGFLAADGSLTNSRIIFELNEKDGYMVKKIKRLHMSRKRSCFQRKNKFLSSIIF